MQTSTLITNYIILTVVLRNKHPKTRLVVYSDIRKEQHLDRFDSLGIFIVRSIRIQAHHILSS